jgi:hypothetical protein
MNYIISWIKNFFIKAEIKPEIKETPTEIIPVKDKPLICGVAIDYFTNHTIGIELLMGGQYDSDNLKFSEKFAQFIYHITQPSFRQTILDNIRDSNETPEDTLFYQNVVFNIALLDTYKKENTNIKDKEPVVRPLSVFSRQ